MGELAEVGFMYRAASQGIAVAKPYGDSLPYDFLVQHGRRLLRVQVKSCFSPERRGYTGFPIIVACHWGRGKLAYSSDQIDFIAAFIAKYDAWYLIPVESLQNSKNIRLYPSGRKLKRPGGNYERYREAWDLLKDENYGDREEDSAPRSNAAQAELKDTQNR